MTDDMVPSVAVLVAAFDAERFVGQAVRSALAQDYPAARLHVVVVDDGSTDATAAVVAELADLVARGELEVPIAGVFALEEVRDAFRQVELRHTRGKVVLRLGTNK